MACTGVNFTFYTKTYLPNLIVIHVHLILTITLNRNVSVYIPTGAENFFSQGVKRSER
jgi:hypothetical protein